MLTIQRKKSFTILSFISLIFIILFVKLSLWQFNRADEKESILLKIDSAIHSHDHPILNLNQLEHLSDINQIPEYSYVKLEGHFDHQHSIFQANQHFNHQLGYHYLTPFKLKNTQHTILVNRGYITEQELIKRDLEDKNKTETQGNIVLTGIVKNSNSKQYIMGSNIINDPKHPTWTIIQKIDLTDQQTIKTIGYILSYNYINLISPTSTGFILNWQWTNITPDKHKAYAITWLLLAITVILLYSYLCYTSIKYDANTRCY